PANFLPIVFRDNHGLTECIRTDPARRPMPHCRQASANRPISNMAAERSMDWISLGGFDIR
ncbi:hypothetical protein KUA11_17325, partial [Acetobacter estunensis]|nr:hypothetical protein [Acetobacter estunensis]